MEEYERLNNKQKLKYHASKARRTLGEEKKFHLRMGSRIKGGSVLTTFPTSDLGGETTLVRGINYTKEEYDNMSREDKQKYHTMMRERFKKTDIERSKFHNIMSARLRRNSPLPTFFSPEHEEEE